jgi:hypothetical protein
VVWQAALDGRATRFRLVGINNQNFIMQDEATRSWWQQITGAAIQGSRKGARLERVFHDEVTFGVWRREHPGTRVLVPDADSAWMAFSRDWEVETGALPVATRMRLTDSLPPRTLVVGVQVGDDAVAYPFTALEKQSPLLDRVGGIPIMLVLGDDGRSVRAFRPEIDGAFVEFFAVPASAPLELRDAPTGSRWDFSGAVLEGSMTGKALARIAADKDYWFNWKTYHPETRVYNRGRQ